MKQNYKNKNQNNPIIRLMLFLLFVGGVSLSGWGQDQVWTYDFNVGPATHSSGESITFFPSTPAGGGTYRIRIGTAGGELELDGNKAILSAATSTSANKVGVYGWNNPTSAAYVKFELKTSSSDNGRLAIALGNDGLVMNNNNYSANYDNALVIFWINYADGDISSVQRRAGSSNTTISSHGFLTDIEQIVEIYGNNSNAVALYERDDITYSLNDQSWDLWVAGTKISPEDGWPVARNFAANSNLSGFVFFGESSTGNVATITLDDYEYANYLLQPDIEDPILFAAPASLDGFYAIKDDGPSGSKSFELTGANLNGGDVTVTAPAKFYVSTEENSGFGLSVTLSEYDGTARDIWVRLENDDLEVDDYPGNVTIAGGGAESITVGVSGKVFEPFSIPYENEFKTQEDIDKAELQGLVVHNSQNETGGGGYLRIFPDGYVETPTIDFTEYDFLYVNFAATTFGGDQGQTLKLFASANNGGEYSEIASFTITGSYVTYGSLIDLTDAFNTVNGKLKIEMTNGGESTRFQDLEIQNASTAWTGGQDNVWTNADNWTNGVPENYSIVTIQSGSANIPTLSAAATVENLKFESGATILDNEHLTINGNFIMEREISDGGFAWHFLSAPVSGMTIIGSDFVPDPNGGTLPGNFDFYTFDQSADLPWINIRGAGSAPNGSFDANFVPGKGYLVAYDDDYGTTMFQFTGTMQTGSINYPLAYTADKDWSGWNLLGNPYPSAIQWNNDYATQFQQNVVAIYHPNKEGGAGYVNIEQGDFIPANQGFFAHVKSGEGGNNFTFTNAMRAHGGSFMKNDAPAADQLKLRLALNDYWDETIIRSREGSEFSRDRQDALKLFSLNADVPQLYSKSSDQVRLSINSIPHIDEEQPIPLGMRIPAEGVYTISLQELTGTFATESIYLTDLLLEKSVELGMNMDYTFTATPDDDANRFLLHFSPIDDPTNIEEVDETAIQLWFSNNTLFVNSHEHNTAIEVYDISGRRLQSHQLNAGENRLDLNLPAGVYIVQSSGNSHHETMKIIIQ